MPASVSVVRVLVVDDQFLFRRAMTAVVDETDGFEVLRDEVGVQARPARRGMVNRRRHLSGPFPLTAETFHCAPPLTVYHRRPRERLRRARCFQPWHSLAGAATRPGRDDPAGARTGSASCTNVPVWSV